MTAFTGHDAFREELKTKYKTDVDVLISTIKGMTTDRAVDLLIRSIEKVKGGAEPQDSPVWKVAKFIKSGEINNIKERRGLSAKIAKKIGVKHGLVRSILSRYDFNLPPHLKAGKEYPIREVFDKPKVGEQSPGPEVGSSQPELQVYELGKGGGVGEIVIKTGNVEITLRMK